MKASNYQQLKMISSDRIAYGYGISQIMSDEQFLKALQKNYNSQDFASKLSAGLNPSTQYYYLAGFIDALYLLSEHINGQKVDNLGQQLIDMVSEN